MTIAAVEAERPQNKTSSFKWGGAGDFEDVQESG